MSENNNSAFQPPAPQPSPEYVAAFGHGKAYYFICAEWDEVHEQASSMVITADNPAPNPQRTVSHVRSNEVIAVHPLVHAINNQLERMNYCITFALVIRKEQYEFVVNHIKRTLHQQQSG